MSTSVLMAFFSASLQAEALFPSFCFVLRFCQCLLGAPVPFWGRVSRLCS